MAKSFLKRIEPNRAREKVIEWPFPVEGEEQPKITMRVLGFDEMEQAHLAVVDHFKATKPKVDVEDEAFRARDALEKVWRAFRDGADPIAEDVDELAKQPPSVILELYSQWLSFQADVAATPFTAEQMNLVIADLKKNTAGDRLRGWPSTWLIGLIITLVSQPADSTQASELG